MLTINEYKDKLNVLYEDNHIIVVQKFENIPSQADKTNDIDMLSIIKLYLKEKYNKPGNVYLGLVHRLDRPTGGIMVFAKTSKAASRLSDQIRQKKMRKKYLAVVDGKTIKEQYLENYLKKDQRNNISKIVEQNEKNSKLAQLKYTTIEYAKKQDLSLIDVELFTGRHHQIRVQMSNICHSLFGDQKYGNRGKGKQLCLFAYFLEFYHPVSNEKLSFELYPNNIMPGFSNFDFIQNKKSRNENGKNHGMKMEKITE